MTNLRQLLPLATETTAEAVLADAHEAQKMPLAIGAAETVQFCDAVSHKLLQDPRTISFPEFTALGFWLRKSSIQNLLKTHLHAHTQTKNVPAGLAFLLPPGNVTTLFFYNVALSLLCGNVTLVRLSDKDLPAQNLLIDIVGTCLAEAPEALRRRLMIVRYGHDDAITSALSMGCDLRLIWGGDATVTHMRSLPLPPLANEIAFGDRFSSSALKASAYRHANDKARDELVHQFYNDMYWFDQLACASPRLLVWVGDEKTTSEASDDFNSRLASYAEKKRYVPPSGASTAKLSMSYLALHDLPAQTYQVHNPELTTIALSDLSSLSAFKSVNYGFGLLLTSRLDKLNDLAAYADRRDQTLTVWGFSTEERETFTTTCDGRGFDRIVSVGQALAFEPVWDGHNLFAALTRLVRVVPEKTAKNR